MDKSSEWFLFWLGLILSIPIGIATGLLTPKIQQWLESRGKKKAVQKTKDTLAEFKQISAYKDNPDAFTQYLVQVAIRTTFIGSLLAIFAGFLYVFAQLLDLIRLPIREARSALFVLAQVISTMGALMIVNICRRALSTFIKVKNFDEYKSSVKSYLPSGEIV